MYVIGYFNSNLFGLARMQRSTEVRFGEHVFQMTLSAMRVRLVAPGGNPAQINPESLRFNGVIPSDWEIVRPVNLEAGLSRINYENSLTISASQGNLFFNQRLLENPDTELVVLDVARRYLEYPPANFRLNSMVIGLAFVADETELMERPLSIPALAIPYAGITPAVSLRSIYQLGDRHVDITVNESLPGPSGKGSPLNIRGQVSYVVRGRTPPEDLEFVRNTLDNAHSTFETFLEISQSVCAQYIGLGAQS